METNDLQEENRRLREQNAQLLSTLENIRHKMPEEIISAISQGEVDALVVRDGGDQEVIYALQRLSALRQSEEQHRLMLDGVKDYAIYMVDPDGRVANWNKGAARIYGYTTEEIIGQHLSRFFTPEDATEGLPQQELATAVASGHSFEETWRVRKDGSKFWAEGTMTALHDDAGALTGFVKVVRDLTERQKQDAALRASETQFRVFMDNTPAQVWIDDEDGFKRFANPALARELHRPVEDIIGRSLSELIPGHPVSDYLTSNQHVIETGEVFQSIVSSPRHDGSLGKFLIHKFRLGTSPTGRRQVGGVAIDITEREDALAKLQASEERFRGFMEFSPASALIKDREGRYLYVNPAWRRQFHPEPIDWLGKTDYDFWPQETAELFRASDTECLLNSKFIQTEETARSISGNESTWLIMKFPLGQDGQQLGAMAWDITQKIKVQKELEREKTLLKAILTNIPDPIWFKDADGVYRFCNERFAFMLGKQEAEILGRTDYDLSSPSLAESFWARDQVALKSLQPIRYEEWHNFPLEKTQELLEIRKVPTVDSSGDLLGILGMGRNITLQHKAKESLVRFSQELEERVQKRTMELSKKNSEFEYVIGSIPDTVLRVNDQGIISFFKESTANDFIKSGDVFFHNELGKILPNPIGRSLVEEAIRCGKEARIKGETGISEKAISGGTIELRVAPLAGEECLVLVRDISERHKLEEDIKNALIHQKELTEMKSMFINVASHEFRTPMTAVAGSVDLLQNFGDRITPTKRAELLDRILAGVNRLKTIVDDVLTLSRADAHRVEVNKTPTDLQLFFKDVLNEAEVGDTQKHHFELDIAENLDFSQIVTDSKILHHIFSNLISNAIRYSPPETTIKITIGRNEIQFWLRVQDEGIGIPEKDLEHLFESFFRASNVGKISGTGLGLNIAKRYSELLGGQIVLIPTPKGACFQATFPV